MALRAILKTETSYSNTELNAGLCLLLETQGENGGWAYTRGITDAPIMGTIGGILPSTQNIIAVASIAAQQDYSSTPCTTGNYDPIAVLNKGVNFLANYFRHTDGGFGANGQSNALETAMVLEAYIPLIPDEVIIQEAIDYLINQQQADGSWNNDPVQTAYVLKVMTPPTLPLIDTDNDGLPDGVEGYLGTDPTVADARQLLSSNGAHLLTATPLLIQVDKHQYFSQQIATTGGTSPYNWQLLAGTLPTGLTLNAQTGEITGVPTSAGHYVAQIKVNDARQTTSVRINITILDSSYASQDYDNDGMSDLFEAQNGFNPADAKDSQQDADNDGLRNGDEARLGSKVWNADSDGDGMKDGFEYKYGFPFINPATDGTNNGIACSNGLSNYNNGTGLGNDKDCDGLTNKQEHDLGTNPLLSDTDGDGVNDGDEVTQGRNPTVNEGAVVLLLQTLLLQPDADNDGIPDYRDTDDDNDGMPDTWEEQYGLDSKNSADADSDADSDGVSNLIEYQLGLDPSQADTDNDGLSDGDEVNVYLTDPNVSDSDNDGLNDGDEVNLYKTDVNNPDTDGDNETDGSEVSVGRNPTVNEAAVVQLLQSLLLQPDNDSDGIPDYRDTDDDNDGMPDTWETQYGFDPKDAMDAINDADGDTLTNLQEYQAGTNPTSQDSDSDGMTDDWEMFYGFNPIDAADQSSDFDADGLTNYDEFLASTNPILSDTDNDGLSDGDEINIYATDPKNIDFDLDGLTDGDEVNNYKTDLKNPDTDGDNVNDGQEVSLGRNPSVNEGAVVQLLQQLLLRTDTDGDGIPDYRDTDDDNDGMLDVWENQYGLDPKNSSDATTDNDSDTLTNLKEYQNNTDPINPDTDGDGISDGDEVLIYFTDPLALLGRVRLFDV